MLTHPVVLHGGPLDGQTWRVIGISDILTIPLDKKGKPDPRGRVDRAPACLEYRRQKDGRYTFVGAST